MNKDSKGRFIKGSKINLGRICSEEKRKKISDKLKGNIPWNKGGHFSDETKKKMSLARIGKKLSSETRKKMSGRKCPWLSVYSLEHSMEKHWNWKGGVSKEKNYINDQVIRRQKKLKELKRLGSSHTQLEWEQLIRDTGNKCVCCLGNGKLTKDHIIPISRGGSDSIGNLQPLCLDCNVHKNAKTINYLNTDAL